MANMLNPNNNVGDSGAQGFNPVASNATRQADISTAQKVMFIVFSVITLGIFWLYHFVFVTVNRFNQLQNDVNNAASTVDTQLAKRFDMISSLVEAAKSQLKQEREVLEQVTRLRATVGQLNSGALTAAQAGEARAQVEQGMNSVLSRLLVVQENYPELKSDRIVADLMQQTVYMESEIAAARRLYNTYVNEFNTAISTFPRNYVAAKKGYTSMPLFQAASQQRDRVSLTLN
ncbi:hypothetical protein MCSF7_02836 [Mycoplasmopsis columbina SF7]|uniref:LemA family protein n=1 Tax=Mycoplasmopsis columbina SF7 TaxID=1037410 RepID=F9UJA9_9BACT|nr:LemA family protein [Mycoplasmopsis columbina]EGV00528.1 hypothetical protein MCSF7_02836 [Mycoplasmopsis columbina SF7]